MISSISGFWQVNEGDCRQAQRQDITRQGDRQRCVGCLHGWRPSEEGRGWGKGKWERWDCVALCEEYINSVGGSREMDSRKIKHSRCRTATSVQLYEWFTLHVICVVFAQLLEEHQLLTVDKSWPTRGTSDGGFIVNNKITCSKSLECDTYSPSLLMLTCQYLLERLTRMYRLDVRAHTSIDTDTWTPVHEHLHTHSCSQKPTHTLANTQTQSLHLAQCLVSPSVSYFK